MRETSNAIHSGSRESVNLVTEPVGEDCELSIIICTHNRPQYVKELIGILQPQIADSPVEVIVADSASNVEAARQLREMTANVPQIKLIRIDVPGVSGARNAGLRAAKADWIAYLDDDEIPPSGWVSELRQLAARLPPECAACGGNVLPVFPPGMARKLSWRWLAYLSMVDLEGEFDETEAPTFLIGHSLVRGQVLHDIGGFDLRLGRDDNTLLGGEEVLLVRQLAARGWRIWHSSRIVVGHRIPEERLKREWVRKRAFWEGVTTVKVLSIQSPDEICRLVSHTAFKMPVLGALTAIFGNFLDADLRLAFLQGTEFARRQMAGKGEAAGRIAVMCEKISARIPPDALASLDSSADRTFLSPGIESPESEPRL
jgi:glycosyltransferase involved in cell wall biosynthesis